MSHFYRFLLICILTGSLTLGANAQTSTVEESAISYFNRGLHSLTLGDSVIAYQQFEQAYGFSYKEDKITYYYLMLALHLQKAFAVPATLSWLKETTNVIYQSRLQYFLGEYYYQQKQVENAITAFLKVPIEDLNNDEIFKLKFHLGYLLSLIHI